MTNDEMMRLFLKGMNSSSEPSPYSELTDEMYKLQRSFMNSGFSEESATNLAGMLMLGILFSENLKEDK